MENVKDLTISEVSEVLQCHRITTTGLIKSGKLRAYRLGADYRITKESLDAFRAASN
jgi:excisionase family DNA binding protein